MCAAKRAEKHKRRRARRVHERRRKLEKDRARKKLLEDTIRDLTPLPPDHWVYEPKDFHMEMAEKFGISRAAMKHLNFGLLYGMDFGYPKSQIDLVNMPKPKASFDAFVQKMHEYSLLDAKMTLSIYEAFHGKNGTKQAAQASSAG